jgi:hypothetical protein
MNESIKLAIEALPEQLVREALVTLLSPHFSPVFGAAKTVEHEVAAINALQNMGVLSINPEPFELITKLRVTKAKATSLLYQVELRRSIDDTAWDNRIKHVLLSPVVARDHDYFSVNIDTPLLKEVIRERLKKLGVAVDDTFASDLLRIPSPGFMKLVVSLMTPQEKLAAEAILAKAGISTSKTKNLALGLAQKFGEKFAGEAGGVLGKEAAQWLVALFSPVSPVQYA